MNAGQFITQNLIGILTILGSLGVGAFTWGMWTGRWKDLTGKVQMIDSHGSMFSQQAISRIHGQIENYDRRFDAYEESRKELFDKVNEMDKKIAVIVAWVEEEKNIHSR